MGNIADCFPAEGNPSREGTVLTEEERKKVLQAANARKAKILAHLKSFDRHEENEQRYEWLLEKWEEKAPPEPSPKLVKFVDIENLKFQCVMVDCRVEEERNVSVLPNAIMSEDFLENESAYIQQDLSIIFYDDIGLNACGIASEVISRNSERDNICVYKGGVIDWCHNGGNLVSKDTGSNVKEVFINSHISKYFPYEMGYKYVDKEDETLGGAGSC